MFYLPFFELRGGNILSSFFNLSVAGLKPYHILSTLGSLYIYIFIYICMQTYVSAGEAIRGKQEGCNFSIEKLQHVWRRNSSSLHKMMTKSMKRAGGLTYELLQSW